MLNRKRVKFISFAAVWLEFVIEIGRGLSFMVTRYFLSSFLLVECLRGELFMHDPLSTHCITIGNIFLIKEIQCSPSFPRFLSLPLSPPISIFTLFPSFTLSLHVRLLRYIEWKREPENVKLIKHYNVHFNKGFQTSASYIKEHFCLLLTLDRLVISCLTGVAVYRIYFDIRFMLLVSVRFLYQRGRFNSLNFESDAWDCFDIWIVKNRSKS